MGKLNQNLKSLHSEQCAIMAHKIQ
jgi:hypothetical protein